MTTHSQRPMNHVPVVLAMVALCGAATPRAASADWPPCGRAACTAVNSQVHAAITADGADGAILAWQDRRDPRINLFAQHLLASGEVDPQWPLDGQALLRDPLALDQEVIGILSPVIVSDGAGGAIVAWEDNRSNSTETDIFAQHVLASGVVDGTWPANGAPVSVIEGLQNNPAIISDGAGGAILVWMDTRPGASATDIFAQHLLGSGVADSRWPANGLGVGTAAGVQEFPTLVSDGAGGALISWDDARSGSLDIYAQHVLNAGSADPAWPAGGLAVCTADGGQGHPSIASDGAHGAVISWTDSRIVGTAHIFADHVLAAGAVDPVWPVNGRSISDAGVLETRPITIPDGAGGAVVTWQAFSVHLNMYSHHVTAAGVLDPAWPAGGRALSITPRTQSHADAVSDGAGGAVVAWDDSSDIVAQHVLASGALDSAYPDTGRVVCNLPSGQGDPAVVATSGGGAIISWTDGRNSGSSSPDIFAMQVLEATTVDVQASGVSTGVTFALTGPNPVRGGKLMLRYALPKLSLVKMTIFDAGGRRVRELASGARSAGAQTVAWDLRDGDGRPVRAGIYFAQLAVEGQLLTQKFVRLQ